MAVIHRALCDMVSVERRPGEAPACVLEADEEESIDDVYTAMAVSTALPRLAPASTSAAYTVLQPDAGTRPP